MLKFVAKYFILLNIFFIASLPQEKVTLKLNTEIRNLPFGLQTQKTADLPRIGIALSGGGSRSLSQIGVLKSFEENNIPIDIIVGTSMGSIVGGLYSAGYSLADLDSIVRRADWQDLISANETSRNELFVDQKITQDKAVITLRLNGLKPILPTSLSTGHKISNFFTLLTLNAPIHVKYSFDEFLTKYRAVCTDLVTGNMKVLDRGSLSQSMRASSSVSFLLAPVKVDSTLLVDGGLVSNIPVSVVKELGSEYTIAVNTTSPLHSRDELDYPWNVADQIVSIPMKKLNESDLSLADYTIEPDLPATTGFEFGDLELIINAAYEFTNKLDLQQKITDVYVSVFSENLQYFPNLTTGENASVLESDIVSRLGGDSTSSADLYLYLNNILDEGYHKNIYFELYPDSGKTILKVVEEKNPQIKDVVIYAGQEYVKELTTPCLKSLINTTYNGKIILKILMNCLRQFRRDGFSLIDVSKVSFDEKSRILSISFTDGLVDDIIIQGNFRTDEELISREITFKKGELFKYSLLEESLTGLRSTNLFEEVEVVLLKIGPRNIITFKLKERTTELLRLGFKTDNEYQTQILVDIRDENFIGSGTELGAIFSGGTRRRSLTIEHRVNRLFETYLTYKLQAFHGFEDINVYEPSVTQSSSEFINTKTGEYRNAYYGFSFALGAQVKKLGNIITEIKYLRDIIKEKQNYTGSTYSMDLFSLKFALNIDSQDKFAYPTKGLRVNGFYETAQTLIAGDVGFSKLFFDYKGYFSFDSDNTISPSLKLGVADETLPLSQYFSFGGQHKFFGFREYEYTGKQIFTTSLEYRYRLPFKLFFDTYAKARYDLGNIWKQPEDIKFKDFKHGVGLTLSLDTPIGPADFSVGKGFIIKKVLSDKIISWGETVFYFTIGYFY